MSHPINNRCPRGILWKGINSYSSADDDTALTTRSSSGYTQADLDAGHVYVAEDQLKES